MANEPMVFQGLTTHKETRTPKITPPPSVVVSVVAQLRPSSACWIIQTAGLYFRRFGIPTKYSDSHFITLLSNLGQVWMVTTRKTQLPYRMADRHAHGLAGTFQWLSATYF
jgi:hypothetical protein